jgi:hypothetical protein
MPRRSAAASNRLLSSRLAHQQLVNPRFTAPADLVRWFGAVQAQDFFGSLWGLGQRLRGATQAAVEAAIDTRAIVRTWPMRGTLHYVPAEDARWMLALLTPRVIARSAGRYRELELDEATFRRAHAVLVRALRGGKTLTRAEVYAALEKGGVSPAGQRGIHIIGHHAQKGLVCGGPRRGKQPTFVLLDEWLPPAKTPTRDEALATLAVRYFSSHGPATLQDFAWWTGLLVKEAQAAMALAGPSTVRDAPPRARSGSATLLPVWDEYLVAYQDRSAATSGLGPERGRMQVVGSPLILIDGRVRGAWRRTVTPRAVRVLIDPWMPLTRAERRAVEKAADRYAGFLGMPGELMEGSR